MKAIFNLPTFALILLAGLRIQAQQQTFITDIYSFTNGSDGAVPRDTLVLSGNTLYGTAFLGGTNHLGTIFSVNETNGAGFNILHNFAISDGAYPNSGLILCGNKLYGTAYFGSTNFSGSVFAINTDGTGFTVLYAFTTPIAGINSDGEYPEGTLILSGNTLYGTTKAGGTNGNGTVFALNTDGTGFTDLYSFSARIGNNNNDGANPYSELVLSGNTLYGTTQAGGTNGNGTVFALNTDGSGFTDLHAFRSLASSSNGDGASPYDGLILSGNTLYGTAEAGGTNGNGTVFALNTDGSGFTDLYAFSALTGSSNSDGANPYGGLVLSGNMLYGTAEAGGTNGYGTVFALNTNGAGFTVLHTFTGSDGAAPYSGLVLSDYLLYGTTGEGGLDSAGTVFNLSPPPSIPPLNIIQSGNQIVLVYAMTGTNYTLQTTTNLASGTWTNVVNGVPFIAVGLTNSSPAAFFRLH